MKRYRWYSAEWPVNMRMLAQRIKSKPFRDEDLEGFILDRSRENFLEARYVERIEYTDKVLDPFGNELTYDRIIFNQCEFRASSSFPGLELINAPRKTQSLVSRLLEINNFVLTLSSLSVDVLSWVTALQDLAEVNVIINSIQIGDLELAPGTLAKVVIRSDKDVRDASMELSAGKHHNVEKIQFRLHGKYEGTVILENSGSAKVEINRTDDFAEILRLSLARSIKNNISVNRKTTIK